jgi:hypothetical protein
MKRSYPKTRVKRSSDVRVAFLSDTIRKTKSECKQRRNLEFTIDLDYLVTFLESQNGMCALTGWPLEFTRGGEYKGRNNPKGCTIDRIDNSKGYIPGNIQLVCCMPNYVKGSMGLAEFQSMCRDIASKSLLDMVGV